MNDLLKELLVTAQDMENEAEDIAGQQYLGDTDPEQNLRMCLRSFAGKLREMVKQQQEQALDEMVKISEEIGLYEDTKPNPLVKCQQCRCPAGCPCCKDGRCGCKENRINVDSEHYF